MGFLGTSIIILNQTTTVKTKIKQFQIVAFQTNQWMKYYIETFKKLGFHLYTNTILLIIYITYNFSLKI